MSPIATTGGRSGAELKASSHNAALFITPTFTPKFRISRRLMGQIEGDVAVLKQDKDAAGAIYVLMPMRV